MDETELIPLIVASLAAGYGWYRLPVPGAKPGTGNHKKDNYYDPFC